MYRVALYLLDRYRTIDRYLGIKKESSFLFLFVSEMILLGHVDKSELAIKVEITSREAHIHT